MNKGNFEKLYDQDISKLIKKTEDNLKDYLNNRYIYPTNETDYKTYKYYNEVHRELNDDELNNNNNRRIINIILY